MSGIFIVLQKNVNIITVDWGNGAHFPYTKAAANTRIAGAEIASLIRYLNRDFRTRSKQFHLIGHSLGCHVMGFAGERLPLLGRISGKYFAVNCILWSIVRLLHRNIR